jgi:hypothetical protein
MNIMSAGTLPEPGTGRVRHPTSEGQVEQHMIRPTSSRKANSVRSAMTGNDEGGDAEGRLGPDVRPPNPPWQPLAVDEPPSGYLSYFFSDSLSRLPVRAVTRFVGKRYDNKSDPNIETGTYGLFSTCERSMRVGVVTHHRPYLFFVTRVAGVRALAGYYRIGWWTSGPAIAAYKTGETQPPDMMLAATEGRFVIPAIDLAQVAAEADDPSLATWFRLFKSLDPRQTERLLAVVNARPDRTADLIEEVHRLERLNLHHTGARYPGWGQKEGFDWVLARLWLEAVASAPVATAPPYVDKRAIKYWRCMQCGSRADNVAPLKRCPSCHAFGSLVGVNES